MLADIWPSTVDEHGLLMVMLVFTALVLLVVVIGIYFFARWSKKEKDRRAGQVEKALREK